MPCTEFRGRNKRQNLSRRLTSSNSKSRSIVAMREGGRERERQGDGNEEKEMAEIRTPFFQRNQSMS